MILEARMSAAYRAGRAAAAARDRWDTNPYRGSAGDAAERILAVMWRKGYSSMTRSLPRDLSASDVD